MPVYSGEQGRGNRLRTAQGSGQFPETAQHMPQPTPGAGSGPSWSSAASHWGEGNVAQKKNAHIEGTEPA